MDMNSAVNSTRKPGNSLLGHLAGLIAVAMWGYSFVSSKVLLDNGLGPVSIYVLRFILAYILICLISHKRFFANNLRDEFLLAACGVTSGSLYFIAENTALEYTLATNVSLLTSLSPLITVIIVAIMFKEKLGIGTWIGSVLAVLGVACVVFNGASELHVYPVGDMLSLGAALLWSVYSIILKRIDSSYGVWFISRKTFFYGLLTALPFLAFEGVNVPELIHSFSVPAVWGNMLFLGMGASTISYVLWATSVQNIGTVQASNYMYMQSIITLIVSAIVLHEPVTFIGVMGIILIIGGLWGGDKLNEWLGKRISKLN